MSQVYLFSGFKLDCKNWTLYCGDSVVDLPPKMVDTLIHLVAHAGEVVSHKDLMGNVWSGMIVVPGALKRNISMIRNALDDEYPYQIIKTVKNRGYVFALPVTVEAGSDTTDQPIADVDTAPHVNQPETAGFPIAASDTNYSRARSLNRALTLALAVIAMALVFFALLVQPMLHKTTFVATQITTNSEEIPIAAAAISPSGNKIAFADPTGLYVGDVTGFERRPVSLPDRLIPSYVQWFPDEFHLLVTGANTTSGESSVWQTSIMGGKPTLLLENVSLATLSADGQRIAFIRNSNELWIADSDGHNARLLTKADTNITFMLGSRISADGQSVIMGTYDQLEHVSTVATMHIDNGEKKILYVSRNFITDFLLLNDNELLISQQPDIRKMENVLAIVKPGSYTSKSTDAQTQRIAYWQDYSSYNLTASRNGTIISLLNIKGLSADYVADLQESGSSITGVRRMIHSSNQSRPVEWLGDNRTLLYISNDNGQLSLQSQRIDSADIHTLVKDKSNNTRPAVSADQRWAFYFSYDASWISRNSLVRLMKKPLTGGEATLVGTRNDMQWKMRCARTSNLCVLAENTGDKTVFVAFDPDTGRGKELYKVNWSSAATSYDWDLSADGTRIGFIKLNSFPTEIHIVQINQLPIVSTLVSFSGVDRLCSLRWDSDSSGFFAASTNSNGDVLSILHLYTNGSVAVLRRELNNSDSYVIGSSDGKHVAFNKWLQHGNVWLLQRQ